MSAICTFAREELGLRLRGRQEQAVSEFEAGGFQQAVWRCGRRSGKSLMADVLALYDAAARSHLRERMLPGEPRIAAIIAPRLDQAQQHIANLQAHVERSTLLRRMLASRTTDELAFRNGSAIRAYPCSARGMRGGAWSSCILDEFGHFISTEDGNAAGDRVLEAALPSLAQFGREGWLIAISTPLWKVGAFAELCQRADSGRFPYLHGLHASTAEMNPQIDRGWLADRRLEDPELYAREFDAEFIDGAFSYLSAADVAACVRPGRGILPPRVGVRYAGAIDPAYSHDAFALAVAHQDPEGLVIVDGVWTWVRKGHEATLDAVADVARAYGVRQLVTDQHAAQPVLEGLQGRRVRVKYAPWTSQTKSEAFAALKVGLNTRNVELPDDRALVEELCRLEARPTPTGLTRIAAAGDGHDDRAVVVASVVHQLVGRAPGANAMRYAREELARAGLKPAPRPGAVTLDPATRARLEEFVRQDRAAEDAS